MGRILRLLTFFGLLIAPASAGAEVVGSFSPPSPYAGTSATRAFEQKTGQDVKVVSFYHPWGSPNSTVQKPWLEAVARRGDVPLITWEPRTPGNFLSVDRKFNLDSINAGRHDAYIRQYARDLKEYGRAVYLRPLHEPNGWWFPWGGELRGNTAAKIIAAWRRIYVLFKQEGNRNARFVYSPVAYDNADIGTYFPGKSFVDVLALDGFNFGKDDPQGGGRRSFNGVFRESYKRIAALDRSAPIWIAEISSTFDRGFRPTFLRSARIALDSAEYRRISVVVWFDDIGRSGADFRLRDGATLSEFRRWG